MTATDEAILRSYAKDYADAYNNHTDYRTLRARDRLVKTAMKLSGYKFNSKGEYEYETGGIQKSLAAY